MIVPSKNWDEWTWDDCKKLYRRFPSAIEQMLQISPDSVSEIELQALRDSLEIERRMIALIEMLETIPELNTCFKTVSHNTLEFGLSSNDKNLDIVVAWRKPNTYHFFTKIGKRYYIDDVPLDKVVETVSHYLHVLNDSESEG